MSANGAFLIYCLELYRQYKGLTGREVYDLFHETGTDDYVRASFGALHTTGQKYILSDLEGFIDSRKSA